MDFLLEYKSFYNIGDIVVIEYWYNHMLCPCQILERRGNKVVISHNIPQSKIQNAPDQLIPINAIIDKFKLKD